MDAQGIAYLSGGMAMGLAAVGCGLSIGWLARASVEGSARQPEAAGGIRTTMIIAAALVEAISLYTFVIAILLVTK